MKRLLILLLLASIASPAVAQEWNDYQKGIAEGLKIGFFMNEKYNQAKQGINVTGYNQEVAKYNAWIVSIFGNDPQFLMTPIAEDTTAQKPTLITNTSNMATGIVHKIDGQSPKGPAYTTNDMNLLPDPQNTTQIKKEGGAWLGGV